MGIPGYRKRTSRRARSCGVEPGCEIAPSLRAERSNPFFLGAVGWIASRSAPAMTVIGRNVTSRSRGAMRPKFCISSPPGKSEGAGKTGCAPHPRSRVQWIDSGRTRAYRFGGSSGLPCAMALRLIRVRPGDRLSCHRHPGKRLLPSRLDASTGASGPHDFTVRSGIVRPHIAARNTIASTATSPNVCDDGRRPSGGKGWRELWR